MKQNYNQLIKISFCVFSVFLFSNSEAKADVEILPTLNEIEIPDDIFIPVMDEELVKELQFCRDNFSVDMINCLISPEPNCLDDAISRFDECMECVDESYNFSQDDADE